MKIKSKRKRRCKGQAGEGTEKGGKEGVERACGGRSSKTTRKKVKWK